MPTRPFCQRVQEIVLAKPPAASAASFQQALASALDALADDGAARLEALAGLARVLNDGVPCGALALELHRLGTVLNLYRYERDASWRLGTHRARRSLIDELWRRSTSGVGHELAISLSRGAVLLAAEEGPPFGLATVRWLASEPSFGDRTRLPNEQLNAIAFELDGEEVTTRSFVEALDRAKDELEAILAEQDAMDDAVTARLIAELESIAALAAYRPDVQWRLANLAWRLANTARADGRDDVLISLGTSVGRWKGNLREVSAARWLDEAMSAPAPPLRTAGFRRVSAGEAPR